MISCRRSATIVVSCFLFLFFVVSRVLAQTSATGQIVGTVSDPTKAVISTAHITAKNAETGFARETKANAAGEYTLPLMPPGVYVVSVTAEGFKTKVNMNVTVQVATTATVNIALEIGAASEMVNVNENAEVLQTQDVSNGDTVSAGTVTGLPLTNRNYTQILGLNPGVASAVPNAATLGRNNVDVNVNGSQVMDNSYQMDGQDVSNMQTQGTTNVVSIGGISVPSPDAIQEFKVQTSLYDAAYGRGAGANVDVVTKSGTDQIHGNLFEFVRNNIFNANDYFVKKTGQPRPELKQNQFGGTVGGPILKHRIFYFGSYQGTRQVSGLGAASLQSVVLPLLTNNRTAAALGQAFCKNGGGVNGGVALACDGSNINPVALTLLNQKLPNGNYFIPTPQLTQVNGAGVLTGFSSFSIPSTYTENQYLVNADYTLSNKHQLAERFFWAKAPQVSSFTSSNVPGSGVTSVFRNVNATLRDTYVASPSLVNEANAGYHRTYGITNTNNTIKASDLAITPACNNPIMPIINVLGSFSIGGNGNDQQDTVSQAFAVHDQVSYVHANHNIRGGFGWERISTPVADPGVTRGTLTINSFQDFLLGMSAAQNGSNPGYSNIFSASGACGDTSHSYRVTDFESFAQDDYKVTPHVTMNIGMRWDIYGAVSDATGKLVNFYPSLANNNFGTTGTFSGLVAASNFQGALPAGVVRNSNKTFAQNPWDLSNFGPRIGISWSPEGLTRFVFRAGYGVYYSRTSVNDTFQLFQNPPFYRSQSNSGPLNAAATFQVPFNPAPPSFSSFPVFVPRTATSTFSLGVNDPTWRTPLTQQWGTNVQYEVSSNIVLQVGYVGTGGQHLSVTQSLNQAYLANPQAPVNGITTNTVANAVQRVPYLGLSPTGLSNHTEKAMSSYHALQASLTKRMSKYIQYGVAYTFGKALADVTGSGTFPNGGSITNDNRNLGQNWGLADYDTKHRLVSNFVLNLPSFHNGDGFGGYLLSQWSMSGVVIIQSGPPLTFTDARSGTIYGLSTQRAQLCPGLTNNSVPTSGSVEQRLNKFFNASAFCAPATIGNGFDFGKTSRGIVRGTGQHNADIAVTKELPVRVFRDNTAFQFRVELYNALNTPQFSSTTAVQGATPMTLVNSLNFGQITSTAVSPRLIQLGLKYKF